MSTGSAPAQKENRLSDREAYAAFDAARVAMVLSDPHTHDNPIVYVNRAFTETTGYSARAAVGRNCRFLQGDDTDPEEVQRIREAFVPRDENFLILAADYSQIGLRIAAELSGDENGCRGRTLCQDHLNPYYKLLSTREGREKCKI